MSRLIEIIKEEIMTTVANYPQFGNRLKSISETDDDEDIERKIKIKSDIKEI